MVLLPWRDSHNHDVHRADQLSPHSRNMSDDQRLSVLLPIGKRDPNGTMVSKVYYIYMFFCHI